MLCCTTLAQIGTYKMETTGLQYWAVERFGATASQGVYYSMILWGTSFMLHLVMVRIGISTCRFRNYTSWDTIIETGFHQHAILWLSIFIDLDSCYRRDYRAVNTEYDVMVSSSRSARVVRDVSLFSVQERCNSINPLSTPECYAITKCEWFLIWVSLMVPSSFP